MVNKPIIGANLNDYATFDNSVVFLSNIPERLADEYTDALKRLVSEKSRDQQISLVSHHESQAGIACALAPFQSQGKMAMELIVVVFDRKKATGIVNDSPNTRGLPLILQAAVWYAVARFYPEGNLNLERGPSDDETLQITLKKLVDSAFLNFMRRRS